MTPTQKIATELLTKFPDAHTKTLARIAYREYPAAFASVESARNVIRNLRGANGRQPAVKDFIRPKGKPGDPFAKLPKGKQHFDKWGAVQFGGPRRCLVLSDIHIPYHDVASLRVALEYGVEHKADTIVLNGDTADFFSVSFWEKNPLERNFSGEVEDTRAFLGTLREVFPDAELVFKMGNHEERFVRYMTAKAPELLGVADFELPHLFEFAKLGIQLVDERRPIRLGKLNLVHGHEWRSISAPVNPARGFFLKAKTHVLGGHLHQSSQHSEKDLEQKVVSTWSTGCLCDLHPDYAPLNNWNHGFAFVEVEKDGTFDVQNLKIIGGGVY